MLQCGLNAPRLLCAEIVDGDPRLPQGGERFASYPEHGPAEKANTMHDLQAIAQICVCDRVSVWRLADESCRAHHFKSWVFCKCLPDLADTLGVARDGGNELATPVVAIRDVLPEQPAYGAQVTGVVAAFFSVQLENQVVVV